MPDEDLPVPVPGQSWNDNRRMGRVRILAELPSAPEGLSDRDTFLVQLTEASAARLAVHAVRPLPFKPAKGPPFRLETVFHCEDPDCHSPPFILYQKESTGAAHLMARAAFLSGRFSPGPQGAKSTSD
jgi:hypothetical protein